jgi:hypothetical protein
LAKWTANSSVKGLASMFLLLLKNWLYPWDYFQTRDHINLLISPD